MSPLLLGLARRQVESATWFLRQLPAGGDIVYDGEDRDWLLGLTGEARRSIDATSLATADGGAHGLDGGLWVSDLGARYLDRQREAIDRNVLIRRIFVFENENLAQDQTFLKITQMHRDIGVDVRTLNHRLIPPWLHWAVSDFIVFDSTVSYEIGFHAWAIKPVIVRTSLSCARDRIRDLDRQFDQLWQAADPERQPS